MDHQRKHCCAAVAGFAVAVSIGFVIALLPASPVLSAPTVIYDHSGAVIGVDDADIGGRLYDVDFITGLYGDLAAEGGFPFLGNVRAAYIAAQGVAEAVRFTDHPTINVPYAAPAGGSVYANIVSRSRFGVPFETRSATQTVYQYAVMRPSGPFVDVDIDPWSSADAVEPDVGSFFIAIMGKNLLAGDDFSFYVDQIDPATLRLGPTDAVNIASAPLYGDYDGDGLTDAAFAFRARDSGIRCGDTEVVLRGKTLLGGPFEGTAALNTVGCPVLQPWSAGTLTVFATKSILTSAFNGNAGNERLADNLLGSGTEVLIHQPYYSTGNIPYYFPSYYDSLPGVTMTIQRARISRSMLDNVDLLFLYIGSGEIAPYNDAELMNVRDYLYRGGQVALVAEGGINTPGYMTTFNHLLEFIGSSIRYQVSSMSPWDSSGPHFADTLLTVPLTAGVTELAINNTNNLIGGVPAVQDAGYTAVAYEVLAVDTVGVDVDPWSLANAVDPNGTAPIYVSIQGASTAAGDASNFDVQQIVPASLVLGPNSARNIAGVPLYGDYDNDGVTDAAFAFATPDTGIACGDTQVTLQGRTGNGGLFQGVSAIDTSACNTSTCHP